MWTFHRPSNFVHSHLKSLTVAQLSSFWSDRRVGDRFSVWWSFADNPNDQDMWIGEKLDATKVLYATDAGKCTKHWPPEDGVLVQKLEFLEGNTKRGKRGTRLKHTSKGTTAVEAELDDTVKNVQGHDHTYGSFLDPQLPGDDRIQWRENANGGVVQGRQHQEDDDRVQDVASTTPPAGPRPAFLQEALHEGDLGGK
jgi:hypothetical protein